MNADDSRVAGILGEWQERLDGGEDIDPERVIAEHPELAAELREQFAALSQLRQAHDAKPLPTRLRTLPVDRYGEFKPAGEGGMGIVYWAIDTDLNREVAFKVIRPGAGSSTSPLDLSSPAKDTPASQAFETLKQRFLQEAWVTGGLSHPGIVPVYELGETPEGVPYYTMRFIKGERTLGTAIDEAKDADVEQRLRLLEPFLKVCDTLSYAHAQGVIHRDLKPDNIALGEFGEVVVIDWGLAKIQDRPDVAHERWQDRIQEYREATDLRTVASAMGTPGYMAPEAAKGQADRMNARSDVYSLGAILFQILTGRLPFEFTTFGELMMKVLQEDPPTAVDVAEGIPQALSELCARCLARDADTRPKSADELARSIRDWQAQSAVDREIEGHLRDARAALSAAAPLSGDLRIRQLDTAAASCAQVLRLAAEHERATTLVADIAALREQGLKEREHAARRQTIVRVGVAAALLLVAAGVIFGWLLDRRREEADAARQLAQLRLADTWTEQGRQELIARRPDRALVYLSAAYETGSTDPLLRLLLVQALAHAEREIHVLRGHEAPVACTDFSPDERRLVTASLDGTARVWDVETGAGLLTLRGHAGGVLTARFDPSGDRIVTAGEDHTARLWDASSGACLVTLVGHEKALTDARFGPAGERVLTVSNDGTSRLWDAATGERRAVLHRPGQGWAWSHNVRGTYDMARSARFSPDGSLILTTKGTPEVDLWDGDGRHLRTLKGHEHAVHSAEFSHDGLHVVTAGWDEVVRIWHAWTGKLVAQLDGHEKGRKHAAFLPPDWPGQLRVVTTDFRDDASKVRIWGVENDVTKLAATVDTEPPRGADGELGVRGSPTGDWVVGLIDRSTVAAWAPSTGVLHSRFEHPDWVACTAFSSKGRRMATGCFDSTARIWHVYPPSCLATIEGTATYHGSPFDAGGDRIVVRTDPKGRTAAVVSTRADGRRASLPTLGPSARYESLCFSPSGRRVIAESSDCTVRIADATTGELVLTLGDPGSRVRVAAFDPDGNRVLALLADGAVEIRSIETGETEKRLGTVALPDEVDDWYSGEVLWRPDGTQVLATLGKAASIWDAATGEQLLAIDRFGHGAAYSPDGRSLVSVSTFFEGEGPLTCVWDAESGERMLNLSVDGASAGKGSFSADGTRIVTAWTGKARLWDAADGRLLHTLPAVTGGRETAFTPDGRWVITQAWLWGAGDPEKRPVELWSVETGERRPPFSWQTSRLDFIEYSADGLHVLARQEDQGPALYGSDGETLLHRYAKDSWRPRSEYGVLHPRGVCFLDMRFDGSIAVRDLDAGAAQADLESHPGQVGMGMVWSNRPTFSRDGRRVLSVTHEGIAAVWDTDTRKLVRVWGGLENYVSAAVFGPREERLLVTCGESVLWILDAATGEVLATLDDPENYLSALLDRSQIRILPAGDRVVTLGDGDIHFWDTHTGRHVSTIDSVDTACLDVDAAGSRLAAGGEEGVVCVWDLEEERLVHRFQEGTGSVGVRWLGRQGRLLAVTCAEGPTHVWDMTHETRLFSLEGKGGISPLALSPDGTVLATCSGDGSAQLWDARSGRLLVRLEGCAVDSAAFTPDGRRLLTWGYGTAGQVWNLGDIGRSPAEVAALTREHVAFRLERGQLVPHAEASSEEHVSMDEREERADLAGMQWGVALQARCAGDLEKAQRHEEAAEAAWQGAQAGIPTWRSFAETWLEHLEDTVLALDEENDPDGALHFCRRTLEVVSGLHERDPSDGFWLSRIADAREELAKRLVAEEPEARLTRWQAVVEARRSEAEAAGFSGIESLAWWELGEARAQAAVLLEELGEDERALDHYRAALEERQRYDTVTGGAYFTSYLEGDLLRTDRMLRLCRRRAGEAPEDEGRLHDLAEALAARAEALERSGTPDTSRLHVEAVRCRETLEEYKPDDPDRLEALALALTRLAWAHQREGRAVPEQRLHHQRALGIRRDLAERESNDPQRLRWLADSLEGEAFCLDASDRREEAREHRLRALELLEEAAELGPQHPRQWTRLGDARKTLGRYADAAEAYRRCLDANPTSRLYDQVHRSHLSALELSRVVEHAPPGPWLVITWVEDGARASKLGIRPGDFLVRIDETPITSLNDYYRTWGATAGQDSTSIWLRREAEEIEVVVEKPGGKLGYYLENLPATR